MFKLTRLILIAALAAGFYGLAILVALTTPWSIIILIVLAQPGRAGAAAAGGT